MRMKKNFDKRYTLNTASVPVRVLESGGEGGLQEQEATALVCVPLFRRFPCWTQFSLIEFPTGLD